METLLGGRKVTRFNMNGEQYDVIVQVDPSDRRTPGDLQDIYVRGQGGAMVQLSNLISVRESVSPKELNRFNQLRAAKISGNLAPGYSLGEALDYLEATAATVLPSSARTDYGGVSREFRQTGSSLAFIFVLALGFIYLVLSAQFESFVDPFIIMLTVPLSMLGALAAMHYTGGTLNIYSQIGLVTLIGLITKHGILIVQFANQLQEAGQGRREAVIEAAALRLRPILMTTGAMVFGAVPLALAGGAGRREPTGDRLGHRRRHELRHGADAVRRADRLHAVLPRPGEDPRGRRRKHPAGGIGRAAGLLMSADRHADAALLSPPLWERMGPGSRLRLARGDGMRMGRGRAECRLRRVMLECEHRHTHPSPPLRGRCPRKGDRGGSGHQPILPSHAAGDTLALAPLSGRHPSARPSTRRPLPSLGRHPRPRAGIHWQPRRMWWSQAGCGGRGALCRSRAGTRSSPLADGTGTRMPRSCRLRSGNEWAPDLAMLVRGDSRV